MKKMPCLFKRNFDGPSSAAITREVAPGCEWVLAGEGTASRKWDGTACAVIGGVLHKRFDAKKDPRTGAHKAPPAGAVPCQPEPDPVTGHWPHWVPVDRRKPEDRHHVAVLALCDETLPDGTFELIGPPIGGNADGLPLQLRKHGDTPLDPPRDFDGLLAFLTEHHIEGIVFAHPDGRRCKIRRDDFGLPWGRR